jgi:hypothetical protein
MGPIPSLPTDIDECFSRFSESPSRFFLSRRLPICALFSKQFAGGVDDAQCEGIYVKDTGMIAVHSEPEETVHNNHKNIMTCMRN